MELIIRDFSGLSVVANLSSTHAPPGWAKRSWFLRTFEQEKELGALESSVVYRLVIVMVVTVVMMMVMMVIVMVVTMAMMMVMMVMAMELVVTIVMDMG